MGVEKKTVPVLLPVGRVTLPPPPVATLPPERVSEARGKPTFLQASSYSVCSYA